MKTSAKIATGLSAAVIAGLVAFAIAPTIAAADRPADAPAATATAATAAPVAESTPESDPADVPEGYVNVGHGTSIPAGGPGECEAPAYIWIGSDAGEPMHAEMGGADLVDMGPLEFAVGEVGLDEQGRPATYTVAPGDVLARIGERFCIYNGLTLGILNGYSHGAVIQPGDVLTLNADLVTDWVDPYAAD